MFESEKCEPKFSDEPKKRKALSLAKKIEILKAVEEKNAPKKDIASDFGIPASTLSTILKNKQSLYSAFESNNVSLDRKKFRACHHQNVEDALFGWYIYARSQNIPISCSILSEKANDFADNLGIRNFRCNLSWIDRFKQRRGINRKVSDKKIKCDDKVELNEIHENTEDSVTLDTALTGINYVQSYLLFRNSVDGVFVPMEIFDKLSDVVTFIVKQSQIKKVTSTVSPAQNEPSADSTIGHVTSSPGRLESDFTDGSSSSHTHEYEPLCKMNKVTSTVSPAQNEPSADSTIGHVTSSPGQLESDSTDGSNSSHTHEYEPLCKMIKLECLDDGTYETSQSTMERQQPGSEIALDNVMSLNKDTEYSMSVQDKDCFERDTSGQGLSNCCDDRSLTTPAASAVGLSDLPGSSDSSGYGALLKYLSVCESDCRKTVVEALHKDMDRYVKDKQSLQERMKEISKERNTLDTDIEQKTARMKCLLSEIDNLEKDLRHMSEERKHKEQQEDDIKHKLRATDLKLQHLDNALTQFQTLTNP